MKMCNKLNVLIQFGGKDNHWSNKGSKSDNCFMKGKGASNCAMGID